METVFGDASQKQQSGIIGALLGAGSALDRAFGLGNLIDGR